MGTLAEGEDTSSESSSGFPSERALHPERCARRFLIYFGIPRSKHDTPPSAVTVRPDHDPNMKIRLGPVVSASCMGVHPGFIYALTRVHTVTSP